MKQAKESQEYDEGVVDVRGEAVEVAAGFPTEMVRDKVSGVPLLRYKLLIDRGLSFERAKELLEESKKNNGTRAEEGFYISKRPMLGREKENVKGTAILLQKPIGSFAINPVAVYRVFRPNTGLSTSMTLEAFAGGHPPRYTRLTAEDMEVHWKRNYAYSGTGCSHGPNCKAGKKCTVGRRQQEMHLLAGAVLPFWETIKNNMGWSKGRVTASGGHSLVKKMSIVRVRCKTADGKELRLVGIQMGEIEIRKLDDEVNNRKPDVKPDIKPKKGAAAARLPVPAGPSSYAAPSNWAAGAASSSPSADVKHDVKPQVGVRVGSR